MNTHTTGTIAEHEELAPIVPPEADWWSQELIDQDDVWQSCVQMVTSGWRPAMRSVVDEDDDEADIQLIEIRREEPSLSHDEVKARLQADGLLPG